MISPATHAGKIEVLVVDDTPANLVTMGAILDRPDYDLVLAQSGEDALRLILRHDFAAILLDVAMPELDGFEVASTIRQRERFRSIPIIFVTSAMQHVDWIFRAYSVGAVDFLQKPLDPHTVRAKVAVFADLHRQKQEIKRQAALLREKEQREREFELEQVRTENARRYRDLADAIPQLVWVGACDGNIEYVNRRWRDTTGMSDADSLGQGWTRAIHPDDLTKLLACWGDGNGGAREFEVECRVRVASGVHRWHLCRALAESISDDEAPTRWLGTFTDIEHQMRAQEAHRAAVQLRDEFLSVASHELRTPLSTLTLQLQSMERHWDAGKEVLRQKLASATRQSNRLSQLIETLLDVSRIAAGQFELHLSDMDLGSVLRETADEFADEAARVGSVIRVDVKSPTHGYWDRLRIEQAIANLLSNAIKYAPGKPIEVVLDRMDDDAKVSVQDHGKGIAPEDMAKIFDRFERAASGNHIGGLGLGLFIVREIVEAHRGHVRATSRVGEGSEFVIELPLHTTH